ncbi:hypothetical protein IVA79_17365 [Bradyrhizobium sp. 138]|uniref:hypothetical protein n=1 Tax=Bradyrhizobium sp. 138 TaxID=2782615 RepID=UPI001FFB5971|nr:hypothetical protein [Bradyrhizobium sp. 138]MCK1735692.1 hypothetical protein [Bradyrhizobium sp. 138]
MASGEMSSAEFAGFLAGVFGNMAQVSVDGAIHFICMDWRHMDEVLKAAGGGVYSELKNLCVWNKSNGGMGSFYRSKHELVFVYKVGQGSHLNTIERRHALCRRPVGHSSVVVFFRRAPATTRCFYQGIRSCSVGSNAT